MPQTYTTGNSQAVRLPADMAFPPKTELIVTREGEKIIVQPVEKTMENVPQLFAALKQLAIGGKLSRPEFVDAERNRGSRGNNGSKV
jgi:antitoxin VapB